MTAESLDMQAQRTAIKQFSLTRNSDGKRHWVRHLLAESLVGERQRLGRRPSPSEPRNEEGIAQIAIPKVVPTLRCCRASHLLTHPYGESMTRTATLLEALSGALTVVSQGRAKVRRGPGIDERLR